MCVQTVHTGYIGADRLQELETLAENGAISDAAFDAIMKQLPAESSFGGGANRNNPVRYSKSHRLTVILLTFSSLLVLPLLKHPWRSWALITNHHPHINQPPLHLSQVVTILPLLYGSLRLQCPRRLQLQCWGWDHCIEGCQWWLVGRQERSY